MLNVNGQKELLIEMNHFKNKILNQIFRYFKFICCHKLFKPKPWVIKKSIFPYKEGYCTYNQKKKLILDTGLTKDDAKTICRQLNKF